MGAEIIIIPCIFAAIFGIAYLHYSTRNKERLSLIEKGMDAGIFKQSREAPPVWKVLVLNMGLLMIGIGLGIFIATALANAYPHNEDAMYPATIFLMGGLGLLAGFFMTSKLIK